MLTSVWLMCSSLYVGMVEMLIHLIAHVCEFNLGVEHE